MKPQPSVDLVGLSPFVLILGVAAAFILSGGALFLKTFRFRRKAQLVDALLVKAEDYGDVRQDGLISYWLHYEYSISDGHVILVRQSSLLQHSPPVGTNRTMLVDPQKPEILRRLGVREYLVPVVIALTGVVMLLVTNILY